MYLYLNEYDVALIEYLTAGQPGYEFSCNQREIWPRAGKGWSRIAARQLIDSPAPAIARAHELITALKPRGGVFGFSFRQGVLYVNGRVAVPAGGQLKVPTLRSGFNWS